MILTLFSEKSHLSFLYFVYIQFVYFVYILLQQNLIDGVVIIDRLIDWLIEDPFFEDLDKKSNSIHFNFWDSLRHN